MKYLILICIVCKCLYADFFPFEEGFPQKTIPSKLKNPENFIAAYENNHFEKTQPSENPRIPKIIHHIWLGSPLPETFKRYVDSWKEYHPGWEHKLWTDADIGSFPLVTGNLINKAHNYGQKSDILRIEILYKFGGLYVDTDFLCLKPHDVIHHTCDFYAGMFDKDVLTGIIGSCPEHPILENYLKSMKKCRCFEARAGEQDIRKAIDVLKATGPYLFTDLITQHLSKDISGIILFPNIYYYPFPGKLRHAFWSKENFDVIKQYLSEHALAVHLWATSWHNVRSPLQKTQICKQPLSKSLKFEKDKEK